MDARQVLTQAVSHLAAHGWSHEGRYIDDEGRLTLSGALMMSHDELEEKVGERASVAVWHEAMRALRAELESRPGARNAFDFNNRLALSASDVRSVLMAAASRV